MKKTKDYYQLEKKIISYKDKIAKLKETTEQVDKAEIGRLQSQIAEEWQRISSGLEPIHFVQIARHPKRPYTLDYIEYLMDDFLEFHGDRRAADDPAIIAGFGFYKGHSLAVIGHQKGRTTRQRLHRNFGQPIPEGYRKALRIMRLAEKFGFPIVTLIDTQGAYPGIQAEERGQAEAIAFNLKEISKLSVPVINIVIGEGGSGGALAVGVGDTVLMLENSFYSVISPEGCAAILWKDQNAVSQAAANLKFLAPDLLEMGIIEGIIAEPPGGAHIDWDLTFSNVDKQLQKTLKDLSDKKPGDLLEARYQKYRKMGVFIEK